MQTLIFTAANGLISVCYFIIALLMLIPFLRGQLKTPLVLATIFIFFCCACGHGTHAVLMGSAMHHMSPQALNVQIAVDLATAFVSLIYVGLRRSYAFLIDGPLLLTQTQGQLAEANAELAGMNAELELRVAARTAELTASNAQLAQEIHDRKLTETRLQRSQELLRQVIDNIPQRIFWKDCDLVYQGCNQRFAELVGLDSTDAVIGKTDKDMPWGSSVSETYRQIDRRVIESNQAQLHVVTAVTETPDGTERWVDVSKVPLHDARGQVVGVLGSSEDITERRQAQAALEEQEARLRSINTVVPGVIYQFALDLTTGEQHFTYVSPMASELFEIEPAALHNISTLARLVHPDDRLVIEQAAGSAIRARTAWCVEFRICTPSGKEKWIRGHSEPMESPADLLLYCGIFLDISDRKRTEAALADSESKFRGLIENANDLIFSVSVIDATLLYLSPKFVDFFGYEPAEFIGKSFVPLVHPDDVVGCFIDLQKAIDTGEKQAGFEFRVFHRDGTMRWMTSNISPVRDANGQLAQIQGILRDISDRKQSEEALNQANGLLNSVIETMPYFFYAKDLQGKHIAINSNLAGFFGRPIAEIVGKSDAELLPLAVASPIMTKDREVMTMGVTARFEEVVPTVGVDCTYLSIKTPLRNPEGSVIGLVGISQDITDLKTAQAALQQSEAELRQRTQDLEQALRELQSTQSQLVHSEKMSSLGQLVAGIAHEINNPVNFIYGNLTPAVEYTQNLMQLLSLYQQHYPLPPVKIQTTIEAVDLEFLIEDLPRLLNSMKVGAERIQKIVLSLRNFSRMDEAEMKVVDLHEGIDSTLLILQSRLRPTRKQIAIEVVKDYGELPLVECYAGQMNQVFMNLLVNAIDALSDRRKQGDCPKILIQTRHIEDQVVAIEISDNGIGIPPEMQSRIFDPFFTTKPIGEGTGLGLSISYQIMQKHQGVLACTSKPNQGTTFRIELPIQPAMPQLAVPRLHSL